MAGMNDTTASRVRELPEGAVAKAIMEWKPNAVGYTPFASGASGLLLKANAMVQCLAASFGDTAADDQCGFALLSDKFKELALEGIGDMILFAKLLSDEQ